MIKYLNKILNNAAGNVMNSKIIRLVLWSRTLNSEFGNSIFWGDWEKWVSRVETGIEPRKERISLFPQRSRIRSKGFALSREQRVSGTVNCPHGSWHLVLVGSGLWQEGVRYRIVQLQRTYVIHYRESAATSRISLAGNSSLPIQNRWTDPAVESFSRGVTGLHRRSNLGS
jgi:hypothetical protein